MGRSGVQVKSGRKKPRENGPFYYNPCEHAGGGTTAFSAAMAQGQRAIPGRDEADQTAQETKQHQASNAAAQSENFTADVVSMMWEIKSPIGRYGGPRRSTFFSISRGPRRRGVHR
jgi:hypothetical protein